VCAGFDLDEQSIVEKGVMRLLQVDRDQLLVRAIPDASVTVAQLFMHGFCAE
jgi:hypothetical protein